MTTNYPNSIDNFVNPAGTATLASPDHAGQHTDINDAVEAIETELGTLPKGSKASVKARLDDVDTSLALVGSAARPFNTAGAYLSGSGLVFSGLAGEHARTPDSSALEISGDIDIQVRMTLPDWTPSTEFSIINKWGAGAVAGREWDFRLTTTGALSIAWNNSAGTLLSKTSTAVISAADGAELYVRVTMDVDNGASGFDVKFYTSLNGSTWTQLGTTITTAGTTSIVTSTANALTIGGTVAGSILPLIGTVQRAIIRNGYDGAGVVVFDADFSTQTADALAFNATSDAGIKADGLVLKGVVGQYASAPDSAALSITGDIDIKAKVTLPDWTPATTMILVGKLTFTQASYSFYVQTDGTFNLSTSTDGTTTFFNPSSVATGFADGTTKWVRATLDVNDGAGNRVAKFYTSDNGTSWTQLGTTVTTAGATSIFDSTSALEIGSRFSGQLPTTGTIHEVIIQSAYDTADNTASLVFDADFDAQAIGTTSFVESSSNAAVVTMQNTNPTVTINTTRYSYGIPNAQSGSISTATLTINNDRYQRFTITKPTVIDMVMMEVTSAPASAATVYFGLYAADTNLQPTGNVLLATDLAVASGATGVFRKQFTPVTLQAGTYLLATNPSVQIVVRTLINGDAAIVSTYGSSGAFNILSRSRTAAAFGNSPSAWNTITTGSTVGSFNYALLRWKPAS